MKVAIAHRSIIITLLIAVYLLAVMPIQAQSTNLLANGDFEAGFTTASGDQPRSVANNWTAWNAPRIASMPSFQNTQPKYIASSSASSQGVVSRIRSGTNAQIYYSFFETHDGGLYQRITGITPGTELRFSVYAYVWSTTFDDPNLSEEPGEVTLRVGIDPNGGTDGLASNIVYSTPLVAYDAYREYNVIATAQSSSVTVFIRSTVGQPVQHSYIYLDDALLAPTTPTVTATATFTPQPPTSTPTVTPTIAPTITLIAPTATVPTIVPSNTPEPEDPTPTPETVGQVPTATPIGQQPTTTPTPSGGTGGVSNDVLNRLPGRLIHTVRRGDTVGRIASLYGSNIEAISQLNGLDTNVLIFVGQALIVPVSIANPATEVPTVTPVAPVIPTLNPGTGGANIPSGTSTYIVRTGDTLNIIARRFNTTVATLTQLNGILNPNFIFVGQRLIVPGATGGAITVPTSPAPTTSPAPVATYMVLPGDTLYSIALRFNVNIVALANTNNISNYNRIFIGQVLVLPR